jgi:hypothetical protein
MSQGLNLKPIATCERGKQRFYDPIEAQAFCDVLAAKNRFTGMGKAGRELIVYWCEVCQSFHVGHKEGGAR